jgi:hypothetical protein
MLDFYVMPNREMAWSEETHLHMGGMTGDEWQALFNEALGCPMGIDEPYIHGEDVNGWEERVRLKFQSAIPDYPLLGEAWHYYYGAWYEPEEIEQLRDECRKAQANISNPVALNVLGQLIRACDEALRRKSGLMLAGD